MPFYYIEKYIYYLVRETIIANQVANMVKRFVTGDNFNCPQCGIRLRVEYIIREENLPPGVAMEQIDDILWWDGLVLDQKNKDSKRG